MVRIHAGQLPGGPARSALGFVSKKWENIATAMFLHPPIPILRIFDEGTAREFYVGFLGFKMDFEHRFGDNFPLFMQVSKDGCVLQLSGHHGDACPGASLAVRTDDLDGYVRTLREKDYKHSKPGIKITEWGTRQTEIKDPFGNKLIFFAPK